MTRRPPEPLLTPLDGVSYLLHFSGPSGFEQTITLKPGGEPVVVGRDAEAAVYLPDTERLVSRRHVAITWAEEGASLKVLSANGISTDQGDYFSGDEVVLADGEGARIGSFSLMVSAVQAAVDLDATSFSGMGTRPVPAGPDTRAAPAPGTGQEPDPWEALASEWSDAPQPGSAASPGPAPERASSVSFDVDDPFASSTSWRLEDDAFAAPAVPSTTDLDPLAALAHSTSVPTPTPAPAGPGPERMALQALCRGLGVEAPQVLTSFDWERLGASVRHIVQCLSDQLATRIESKRDMRAEDRTMLGSKEANPLRAGMPLNEMLQYLLFMPEGASGFVPANRALQEVAQEARSHETAAKAAARGLAEGALKEFEPAKLRAHLLKGKLSIGSVVDNARLWDLYATHYEKKGEKLADWGEQLFNRYYMAAYLREVERLRRARMPPPAQRTE